METRSMCVQNSQKRFFYIYTPARYRKSCNKYNTTKAKIVHDLPENNHHQEKVSKVKIKPKTRNKSRFSRKMREIIIMYDTQFLQIRSGTNILQQ